MPKPGSPFREVSAMERDVYEPIHSTGRRFVKGISRLGQIDRVTASWFRNTERFLKHYGAPALHARCHHARQSPGQQVRVAERLGLSCMAISARDQRRALIARAS